MSDSHSSPHDSLPTPSRRFQSAIGWVVVMLLFGIILAVAYLPNRPDDTQTEAIQARFAIRQDVMNAQQQLVNEYAWVNQQTGVVRIPVERAMELVLPELEAKQAELNVDVYRPEVYEPQAPRPLPNMADWDHLREEVSSHHDPYHKADGEHAPAHQDEHGVKPEAHPAH